MNRDFNPESLDDNQLIEIYRTSDQECGRQAVSELISRYLRLVRKRAYEYSRDYAEPEDLAQEGLLSLLGAVDSFDPERGAKFSSFADVCVTNGIRSAARKLGRDAPVDSGSSDGESGSEESSPENIWFEKERADYVYGRIQSSLSEKEWEIFRLYLCGLSYGEIAGKLGISQKSVDNAVFRVRKKLRSLFSEGV